MKIFPKQLLAMLFLAVIPLAGLWYNVHQSQEDWEANSASRLTQNADLLSNQIDNWLNKNERALQNTASLRDITSMDPERQKPVLKSLLDSYEWGYLTHTMGLDGKNVTRNDNKPLKNYADRDYVKQVLRGQPFGYQLIISRTTGRPALAISAPIYADGTEQRIGVISLAAHLVDISKAVADVKIGETGFAILVNQEGKVVAHGRPQKLYDQFQDLSAHPGFRDGATGKQVTFEDNGKQIVAYSQRTNNGWVLILQQDYNEAFAPLLEARRNSLVLILATLVAVFSVAFILTLRLVKPLASLTAVAEGFSRGGHEAKIPETNRSDEIGALARAIQRMGRAIEMAFQEFSTRPKGRRVA